MITITLNTTVEDLAKYTAAELRDQCIDAGLTKGGSKKQLVDKLWAYHSPKVFELRDAHLAAEEAREERLSIDHADGSLYKECLEELSARIYSELETCKDARLKVMQKIKKWYDADDLGNILHEMEWQYATVKKIEEKHKMYQRELENMQFKNINSEFGMDELIESLERTVQYDMENLLVSDPDGCGRYGVKHEQAVAEESVKKIRTNMFMSFVKALRNSRERQTSAPCQIAWWRG